MQASVSRTPQLVAKYLLTTYVKFKQLWKLRLIYCKGVAPCTPHIENHCDDSLCCNAQKGCVINPNVVVYSNSYYISLWSCLFIMECMYSLFTLINSSVVIYSNSYVAAYYIKLCLLAFFIME